MTQVTNQPAPAATNGVIKRELSHSERFAQAVEKEFSGGIKNVELTSFQRKLCQNYFIRIDSILKDNEIKRMAKPEKYRDPLPFMWENVNFQKLAVDVIAYSGVGLDPAQDNHISPVLFKNKHTNKFDITFIEGYKGAEVKAKKYGLDLPSDIVVEVVYEKDKFKPIKKDINNKVEGYVFEQSNEFDRGEIVGGFYYHSFECNPSRNKLKTFSKKDIDKRRPDHAAAEFWGGEKDKWEYDPSTGKNKVVGKEQVEGWYDEMVYKTIYKAAYKAVTIDSAKIDENYLAVIQKEQERLDFKVQNEIATKANKKEIGFDDEPPVQHAEVVQDDPVADDEGEVIEESVKAPF